MAEIRVLVIQLRQLGDILLTTPCLRAIKRDLKGAKITFLSHAMGRLVLDDSPFIDEHFFYDDSWSKWRELQFAKTLHDREFDIVFDFMNNPRSALYTFASRAGRRYSFNSSRNFAYTDTAPRGGGVYIVEEKFRLLASAGIDATDRSLALPWFETDTHPVFQLQGKDEVFRDATLRVVLSPTHRRQPRRWSLARYAELADRLVRERSAYVTWIYGPSEEETIERVMAKCQEKTYMAPRTTFREMAAFVANVDLFVGNSNGPSHVAVAVDTPSIQLHGPTDVRSWCPCSERHQGIQAGDGTMEDISVDQVWQTFDGMQEVVEAAAQQRREAGVRVSWSR